MKNNEVALSDFYQAVILKTLNYPLLRLERQNNNFVTFIFEDSKNSHQQDLTDYWNRETKVIARDLISNINELKTRIYSKI